MKNILVMVTFLLLSCSNKIRVSEYAKYNTIDHNWFQTFINDSLQFSIDFFGRNTYTTFRNKTKWVIPKSDIAVLKRLGIRKKAKILLYLKPNVKKWGQESYGYIVDRNSLNLDSSLALFFKTNSGEDFFILNDLYKNQNKTTTTAGGAKIGSKYFILIENQTKAAFEFWDSSSHIKHWDSSNQVGNTSSQLSSILKGEKGLTYIAGRKKITKAIDSSFRISNYFKALNGLRAIPEDTVLHYNLDNFYYQDVVTRVSFFDNLDSIHHVYEQYRSPSTTASPNKKFILNGDAIAKVCEIAKTQKMLMINENHYDFRHRLFVYLLLDKLYKFGYRNLCLEALNHRTDNKYINKEDGFYISEPFMAGVVRKAKEIGFNVYGYDTDANSIPERESGQAKNIYNLYSKDPDHKWIVFAGYSHINKKYFSGESPSALQLFTKLAGFAPCSINQSDLSDITDQRYTVPNPRVGYYAVDTSSFIYKNGQADLYIINNIKKHPFESPFPATRPYLQKYVIDIPRSVNSSESVMVYIKKELEELHDSAIPVYMTLAKKEQPNMLHLPANDYIGVIVDNNGNETANFKVIKESTNSTTNN
jgi:hypothetical protein